jgi:hypothetical protein
MFVINNNETILVVRMKEQVKGRVSKGLLNPAVSWSHLLNGTLSEE